MTILGMVARRGQLGGTPGVTPNRTFAKWRRIQMKRHGRLVIGGISHLVIAHTIGNIRQLGSGINSVVRTFDLRVVALFANRSFHDLHPTSIARMIMNGRFLFRIPTQQQQRERLGVGGN
jgi:hypothetical protein